MGKLSQLFGIHKKPSPDAASLPTLSTELVLSPEPWQGNLPCVHGPTDGCNRHNPSREAIFFDPLLFPASSPAKPSGNHKPNGHYDKNPITISSSLPRTPEAGCLAPLPRVHKSVPYTLPFYHVHAIMSQLRSDTSPSESSLSALACEATTGSNPSLSWTARCVVDNHNSTSVDDATLLVEYALAFTVEADLGSWNESVAHGRAVAKAMLIGSGYRDFTPCRHFTLSFKSHRGEGKNHVRSAGVSFSRRVVGPNGKAEESKEEWRSEEDTVAEPTYCASCWTDTYISFRLVGNVVIVSIQVYKDLGAGAHPADPKWLTAARGVDIQRGPAEFGRMRMVFLEADQEEGQ